MILVVRGPEPAVLIDLRDKHLPALRRITAGGGLPLSADIKGYGHIDVRTALWNAQHHKCCYCEKRIELTREDVEHFRPKAEAQRAPGSPLTHGYWWLAFTWNNLLYSCPQCNQPPAKGARFPLDIGSTPLVAEAPPPGQERPLLIDPGSESGIAHIEFKLQRRGERFKWVPTPRNQSERGRRTIRICMLDRDPLLDHYGEHVIHRVIPEVKAVRAAMKAGDPRGVWTAVARASRTLLSPGQPFVGLSHDALVHHVPNAELSRFDLSWTVAC